ncbi:MAG: Fe-S cluster assembly protein SufD [Propionibacteriaceae bacterium]|jgi:Fe-S cluster assembly protein SufD|nr:Fe-S cluster assembly protein SufD [Propionibacteriaceae bacterium]
MAEGNSPLAAGPLETRTVSHLHPAGSFDLADHPEPTGREEIWRFTPLDQLQPIWADPAAAAVAVTRTSDQGCWAEPLSPGQGSRGSVLVPVDRAAALASARAERADHLRLAAGRRYDQPIRLDLRVDSETGLAAHHLVIEAEAGSSATVLLRHGGQGRYLGNVEIVVGPSAQLTVVSIQDWRPGSSHLGQHEAKVHPKASYRHIAVSLGGDLIRLQNNVSYAGASGAAELLGVYFCDAGQHIEHRLFVDHNHPKGKSLADYRGALQGRRAHAVWVGDVLIRSRAQGIETYESNKNLVLSDGCRADSVPNLEIETGDIVGAGHSASTGRFDDEQLFYLRSRGLDPDEARRLVVRGFFAQLVARIGVPDVEQVLMDKIDRELATGPAL